MQKDKVTFKLLHYCGHTHTQACTHTRKHTHTVLLFIIILEHFLTMGNFFHFIAMYRLYTCCFIAFISHFRLQNFVVYQFLRTISLWHYIIWAMIHCAEMTRKKLYKNWLARSLSRNEETYTTCGDIGSLCYEYIHLFRRIILINA